ncbi:MAG: translesion error-prone DNA polymerase V autoproteolytic subunit [Halopseudomonas aestusnigri]
MMKNDVPTYLGQAVKGSFFPLPLFASKVPAGFPSPAEDYIEGSLDLNEQLIPHPHATFLLKVSGDSMIGAGIMPGGMLVVDRSVEVRHGKVVIAVLDGQLTVKRLYKRQGEIRLMSENPNYKPIKISDEQDLQVWGVVTNVINPLD